VRAKIQDGQRSSSHCFWGYWLWRVGITVGSLQGGSPEREFWMALLYPESWGSDPRLGKIGKILQNLTGQVIPVLSLQA